MYENLDEHCSMRGSLVSTVRPAKARVTYTSAKMALPNGGDRICLFSLLLSISLADQVLESFIKRPFEAPDWPERRLLSFNLLLFTSTHKSVFLLK